MVLSKNTIRWLLLFLIIYAGACIASEATIFSASEYHSGGEISIALEADYQRYGADGELQTKNGKVSLGTTKIKNMSVETVVTYINVLKSKDKQGLVNIHFSEDGSREEISQQIDNQNPFAGYDKVQPTKIIDKLKWGNYDIYSVEYEFGKKKVKSPVTTICVDSGCYISRYLTKTYLPDVSFISVLPSTFGAIYEKPNRVIGKTDLQKNMSDLLVYNFFPGNGKRFGKDYQPIRFYLNIKDYTNRAKYDFSTGKWDSKGVTKELDIIVSFYRKLKTLPEQSLIDDNEELKKLFRKELNDKDADQYSYIINSLVSDKKTGYSYTQSYDSIARYAERAHQWDKIEALGYIQSKNKKYVYFQPYKQDQKDAIQVLAVDITKGKASGLNAQSISAFPMDIIQHPGVMQLVANRFSKKPNKK